ncbi:hypothetical protein [Paracoccus pantotrophus]|uniref:hypothetical protein n=1 Tax=Paracoccus pantotrophus TaxID=82367 RepID=UPI00048FD377|nr:hypothetical protein [Paracoccus pantotrophus]RNI16188.1 hypothetical protein EB844_14805 [Paracoccus pantotrophus]
MRVRTHSVGIWDSNLHYCTHSKIGHFMVRELMVLSHKATSTVIEAGAEVAHQDPRGARLH